MRFIANHLKEALLAGAFCLALFGCKTKDKVYDDPYAGGRIPLGIKMSTDLPSPEVGSPGSTVTYKVTGLLPYKDSLTFYLNNEPAQILAVDSTSIKVKVPENASTGVGSITVGDEIYFGSVFKVNGNVSLDDNFKALVGANGSISDALQLSDSRLIFVGTFTDFEHKGAVKPLNRIVMTSKDGEVDRSLQSGIGADGYLNSITTLPNGKIVIGGGFSSYDTHLGQIHNITILNQNGSLDSIVVRTFLDQDTVPAFNGGTDGNIGKAFVKGNTITAIGNFSYYLQYIYDQPNYSKERDTLITDSVRVKSLVRFFADGSLDSSFNYDFQHHMSYEGPNGPIFDAFMQEDGKLIIVGRFTKYNGENVNDIVRLNDDGTIDRNFKVGNGADNSISTIRYNAVLHRFILAGAFENFDGKPHSGLVLLKEDGSVDETFKPAPKGPSNYYGFAQQLSNGMVIVSGYFTEHEGIHRGNFMILDKTGALAKGYNNLGDLKGGVLSAFETRSSSNKMLVTIMGGFTKINEQSAGSITRLIFNK